MNVFTLHANGDKTCLLCSMHPAITTGRGNNSNIYTTEPARPPRPNRLDNHLSSDQHQKANSLEKLNALHHSISCYSPGSHFK